MNAPSGSAAERPSGAHPRILGTRLALFGDGPHRASRLAVLSAIAAYQEVPADRGFRSPIGRGESVSAVALLLRIRAPHDFLYMARFAG